MALNNAGYNYRQVYFNVTQPATGHSAQDGAPPAGSIADGWGDKGRADAATTAVVVIVVVCGLAGMFASCFVWKRRKSHLKGKALNGPSPPPSASSPSSRPESTSVVVGVQPGSTGASSPLLPAPLPSPASDYSAFRYEPAPWVSCQDDQRPDGASLTVITREKPLRCLQQGLATTNQESYKRRESENQSGEGIALIRRSTKGLKPRKLIDVRVTNSPRL